MTQLERAVKAATELLHDPRNEELLRELQDVVQEARKPDGSMRLRDWVAFHDLCTGHLQIIKAWRQLKDTKSPKK